MRAAHTLLGLAVVTLAPLAQAQSPETGRPDFRLNVQVRPVEPSAMDRLLGRTSSQGLKLGLVSKSGFSSDLGVYGRMDTSSYGVGLSWDFAPRASATVGWDSYDLRTATGDRGARDYLAAREVRLVECGDLASGHDVDAR